VQLNFRADQHEPVRRPVVDRLSVVAATTVAMRVFFQPQSFGSAMIFRSERAVLEDPQVLPTAADTPTRGCTPASALDGGDVAVGWIWPARIALPQAAIARTWNSVPVAAGGR
jgi:hypothetical protein